MSSANAGLSSNTPRDGGLAVWAPKLTPAIGVDLSPEQSLACAFRILAKRGFSQNIAGHITVSRDDESMYVNPWGLWWDEMTASDICVVDTDGKVLEGRWDVTPAIHIHTELHRRRPDAKVVVHNHPYWATVLAAVGLLPEVLHQNDAMFDGDLLLIEEYTGEIDDAQLGAELAARIGDASVILLANHGVIVTAPTIEEATFKSASIDRMCRLAYDVALLRLAPLEIDAGIRVGMKKSMLERGSAVFWAGEVRSLIREYPEVLE